MKLKFCKKCNIAMQETTERGLYFCPSCHVAYYDEYKNESLLKQIMEKHKEEWRERVRNLLEERENIAKQQEEPTMKVSYNGFTGELVKLEVTTNIKGTLQINGADYSKEVFERKYNLEIYDSEKKVTHSFTNVNLKDVKFLGCSVSFE